MICLNVGPVFVQPRMKHPIGIAGGNSHMVNDHGRR
jgi:hypothetical protein